MLDVDLGKTFNSDFDKYFDMIYKKTGSLIEAAATSAALLSGKNHEQFAKYGRCLGLAFQMVDDILDITSDSATLGKPAMNDFVEGKVTIPYLLTYARLESTDQDKLESMYLKELSSDEQAWIKEKMAETEGLQKSIDLAKRYGMEAIRAIENENNPDLENIMKQMIERDF
jgi:octaprenyl-diphosphate synthase